MSRSNTSQAWGDLPVTLYREWRDRHSSVKVWEFEVDSNSYFLTTILPHNAGPGAQWVAAEIRAGSLEGGLIWNFRTDPRRRGANAFCNSSNGKPVLEFVGEALMKGGVLKKSSTKVPLRKILGLPD